MAEPNAPSWYTGTDSLIILFVAIWTTVTVKPWMNLPMTYDGTDTIYMIRQDRILSTLYFINGPFLPVKMTVPPYSAPIDLPICADKLMREL